MRVGKAFVFILKAFVIVSAYMQRFTVYKAYTFIVITCYIIEIYNISPVYFAKMSFRQIPVNACHCFFTPYFSVP